MPGFAEIYESAVMHGHVVHVTVVTLQCGFSTIVEPEFEITPTLQSVRHHDFVVAQQGYQSALGD